MDNFQSILNSYYEEFEPSQIFNGTWESCSEYNYIIVNITTFGNSDDNGFIIELSDDQITIKTTILNTVSTIPNTEYYYPIEGEYFRITYKNGPVSTRHSICLKTTLHRVPIDKYQVIPTDSLTNSQKAIVTRDVSNYKKDVALGLISNVKNYVVNGKCEATDTEQIIFADNFIFPTTVARLKITSGSTNDIFSGTGARAVYVSGLNGDYEEITETILTNGSSDSSWTSQSFLRVNSASVVSSGSLHKNDNDIFITSELDQTLSIIKAGESRSLGSIYTVPKNYCAVIPRVLFMCDNQHSASFKGYFREYSTQTDYLINVMQGLSGSFESKPEELIKFNEKTDLWITATKESGSGNPKVSVCYEINLNRLS